MIQQKPDQIPASPEEATFDRAPAVTASLAEASTLRDIDYGMTPAYPHPTHPTALSLTMFLLSSALTLLAFLKRAAQGRSKFPRGIGHV